MPITDYKITDLERNAVRMEGKEDPFTGTLAQNQAEFDAYPELIRDNPDGLCDFMANIVVSHTVDTAAATAAKTAITGYVPLDSIIEIQFTNGNTSASPTISIDGTVHTITGMPTTAKMASSTNQTYRFRKASSSLVFLAYPDYVCEYGAVDTFRYARYASGRSELFSTSSTSTGTLTMSQISTSAIYGSAEMSLTLPTGVFNSAGYSANINIYSSSYVVGINPQYDTCTATALKYVVLKGGSSSSAVSFRVHLIGTWK